MLDVLAKKKRSSRKEEVKLQCFTDDCLTENAIELNQIICSIKSSTKLMDTKLSNKIYDVLLYQQQQTRKYHKNKTPFTTVIGVGKLWPMRHTHGMSIFFYNNFTTYFFVRNYWNTAMSICLHIVYD